MKNNEIKNYTEEQVWQIFLQHFVNTKHYCQEISRITSPFSQNEINNETISNNINNNIFQENCEILEDDLEPTPHII